VKYLDIPIQHCSTKILKEMNRNATKSSIVKTIKTLRKEIPEIVIRTTLIVGFPGETKEDFEELYKFVADTKFDRLGAFTYSKEENTKAAKMPNQVRKDVKERRKDKIMELQRQISLEKNESYIGKTIQVMVEEIDEEGAYIGRSIYDAEGIDNGVIFTSKKKRKPGDIVNVYIKDAFDYDLSGEETK
ncbi:MAG: radical SAM protein, partial [Clostridia bacterium]|nr:radical SAM protein [Clostridia bacterium]